MFHLSIKRFIDYHYFTATTKHDALFIQAKTAKLMQLFEFTSIHFLTNTVFEIQFDNLTRHSNRQLRTPAFNQNA
jgi:hypothetical protein